MLAVGWFSGIIIGKNMTSISSSLPFERLIIELIFLAVFGIIGFILHIIIHEAGHMVLGLLTGYSFVSFRIFSFMWVNDNGHIRFTRYKVNFAPGQCIMLPPSLDENNQIIGYISIYLSGGGHEFHFKSWQLILVDILDHFVLCDIEKDDLYLAEIAIDESQRGKGMGKKVLHDVIDYARSKNYKRVILDADFRNAGAKKLYESIGFRQFNKKRVEIGSFERGMYNMEFIL